MPKKGLVFLGLSLFVVFGCDRKKDVNGIEWTNSGVAGSSECGDGIRSLVAAAVDNGWGQSDFDSQILSYDRLNDVVSFTELNLGDWERVVRGVVTPEGEVLVVGEARTGTLTQIFVAKFDKELALKWVQTKAGAAAEGSNRGVAVKPDTNGNVWVTGVVDQTAGEEAKHRHIWTAVYSKDGALLAETVERETQLKASDYPVDLERSNENSFYVFGAQKTVPLVVTATIAPAPSYSLVTDTTSPFVYTETIPTLTKVILILPPMDLWLAKYTLKDGKLEKDFEAKRNGTAQDSYDRPGRLRVDSEGNAVVSGVLVNEAKGTDSWIAKFAGQKEPVWERVFDSSGETAVSDSVADLEVGPGNHVYAVGSYAADLWTVKLDAASGATLWEKSEAGDAGLTDAGRDLAVDGQGNAYVIGQVWNQNPQYPARADIFVAKYTAEGEKVFSAVKTGNRGKDSQGIAVAFDSEGALLALGTVPNGYDFKTNFYYPEAYHQDLWAARYHSPSAEPAWERLVAGTRTETFTTEASVSPNTATLLAAKCVARGLFVDEADNVHFHGRLETDATGTDGRYMILDKGGNEKQAIRFNGFADGADDTTFGTKDK